MTSAVKELPISYEDLFSKYRRLVIKQVLSCGIHINDAEDATNNLQTLFWQKDGLDRYDPEKGTSFVSMYRGWLRLSSLNERDKSTLYSSRYTPVGDSYVFSDKPDATLSYVTELEDCQAIKQWGKKASQRLEEAGYLKLLPILELCVESALDSTKLDRRKTVEQLGLSASVLNKRIMDLRVALAELNILPTMLELQDE